MLMRKAATIRASAQQLPKAPAVLRQVKRFVRDLKGRHDALKQDVERGLRAAELPFADFKAANQRASEERAANVSKVTTSIKDALQSEVQFGMEWVQDVRAELVKCWEEDDDEAKTDADEPYKVVVEVVTPEVDAAKK